MARPDVVVARVCGVRWGGGASCVWRGVQAAPQNPAHGGGGGQRGEWGGRGAKGHIAPAIVGATQTPPPSPPRRRRRAGPRLFFCPLLPTTRRGRRVAARGGLVPRDWWIGLLEEVREGGGSGGGTAVGPSTGPCCWSRPLFFSAGTEAGGTGHGGLWDCGMETRGDAVGLYECKGSYQAKYIDDLGGLVKLVDVATVPYPMGCRQRQSFRTRQLSLAGVRALQLGL